MSNILIKERKKENKNNKKAHSRQAIPLFIDPPCQVLLCRHWFYDKTPVLPFMAINNAVCFLSVPVLYGPRAGLVVPSWSLSFKLVAFRVTINFLFLKMVA